MNIETITKRTYNLYDLDEFEFESICDALNILVTQPMSDCARQRIINLLIQLRGY